MVSSRGELKSRCQRQPNLRKGIKETVTIIELCYRLSFLLKADSDLLRDKLAEIGRFLQGLINSLNDKTNNQKQTTKN